MLDDIDQLIVEGVLTTETGANQRTKIKIHRSATKLLFTWSKAYSTSQIQPGDYVSFEGVIGESTMPFSCPRIYIESRISSSPHIYFVGIPMDNTYLGRKGKECISITRHVSALLPNMKGLEIGQYTCSTRQFPVRGLARKLQDVSRQTTQYRSELILEGSPGTKEAFDREACSVLRLLGVMLSASLYTRRTTYCFADTGRVDQYWFNASAGVGSSEIVHSPHEFISSAYPTWNNLSEKLRKAIEVASSYIATSSVGYLDSRLLALFQAWELLANAYDARGNRSDERKKEISIEVANKHELAERLKLAYEEWSEEFPESNFNELCSIEKLIEKCQNIVTKDKVGYLIEASGINREVLKFDINKLRKTADKVRHTGVIEVHDKGGDDLDLYDENKFALQLIIFRILGYKGRIWFRNEQCWFCESMAFYFGTEEEIAQYEREEQLASDKWVADFLSQREASK